MASIAQNPPFSVTEFASYIGLSRFDDTQFLLKKCLEQATCIVTAWSGFVFSRTAVELNWLPANGKFIQIQLFPVWSVSLPTSISATIVPNNDPATPKNHCEIVLDSLPDNTFTYSIDVGDNGLDGYDVYKNAVLEIAELQYRLHTNQKQRPSEINDAISQILSMLPKRGW